MKTTTLSLVHWLFIAALAMTSCAADAAELEIRPGVLLDIGDGTRPNRVWVRMGNTVLGVDTGASDSPFGDPPDLLAMTGFTDSETATPSTIVWPTKRPGSAISAGPSALLIEDGFRLQSRDREVVFFDLGRLATPGDLAVWLPRERILVTGRVCKRAGVAASSESDTGAWIEKLLAFQDLDPELVIPHTGKPGGAELLDAQVTRLLSLRSHVSASLMSGSTRDQATSSFGDQWFVEWLDTEREGAAAAFEAVYNEIGGLQPPWALIEERKLRPGNSPTKQDDGWNPPRKILWRNYWPDRLPMLEQVAPGITIIPFDSSEEALKQVADADAIVGTATPELLSSGPNLRWVQVGSAGVERYLRIPELGSGKVVLTNGQRLASKVIGEHVMALTRALARGLNRAVAAQLEGQWQRSEIGNSAPLTSLRGKTMLVVGLGGIGTEAARLADGAGMRVLAIRNSRRSGPPFVDRVGLNEDLLAYLAESDVVVNCLPLTDSTRGLFDTEHFAAMKETAFFINVGRGGTVKTADLVSALETGSIAGAGLDVTDPEPLTEGHALWKAPNLIITPHFAAWSDGDRELRWLLYRENLRRFAAGEPLLSVVDPERGY